MGLLYQSAFLEALGWSLVDSLWQMGAIWIFYVLSTANGTRFSAEKRHSLALVGTAAGTMIFLISLLLNIYSVANNESYFSLAYFIEKHAGNTFPGSEFARSLIPFLSFIYLPAVLFFALRLIFQVTYNKNTHTKNLVPANDQIGGFVKMMSQQLGVVKNVSLWISEKVESPLTVGFWKPVIILPVAVFSHLTCSQVEAIIAHELYHVKRNDYLLNIFITVAGLVLFFNPFARLMISNVKKERENSCDDHVLSSGFNAWEYSQALYILGKYRYDRSGIAIAATGSGKEYLLQRVRRLMNRNNPSPSIVKPFIAFFLCLCVAGFAGRHRPVTVVANEIMDVKPVLYYSEVKKTIVNEPIIIKKNKPVLKIQIERTEITVNPPDPPPPPDAILLDGEDEDGSQEILTTYIAAPEMLEFTIIDPLSPEVPEVVCETPVPYVPKSTFYFTDVDTTVGKKVIKL